MKCPTSARAILPPPGGGKSGRTRYSPFPGSLTSLVARTSVAAGRLGELGPLGGTRVLLALKQRIDVRRATAKHPRVFHDLDAVGLQQPSRRLVQQRELGTAAQVEQQVPAFQRTDPVSDGTA